MVKNFSLVSLIHLFIVCGKKIFNKCFFFDIFMFIVCGKKDCFIFSVLIIVFSLIFSQS